MLKKILIGTVASAAVLGISWGATANASVGPAEFSSTGSQSISGYFAHALNNSVSFTHITSYAGSDGSHTIEQLPVTTSVTPGSANILGAAGIGLCNQSTGAAAQVGLVYVGGGLVDVVYGTGNFKAPVVNNSDLCQNGIVNPTGLNGSPTTTTVLSFTTTAGKNWLVPISPGVAPAIGTKVTVTHTTPNIPAFDTTYFVVAPTGGAPAGSFALATTPGGTPITAPIATNGTLRWVTLGGNIGDSFGVLKANIPDNDTVSLDILYDSHSAYTFKGHHHAAGTVTFSATDLSSNPGVSYQASTTAPGKSFTEADTGAIANDQNVTALPGTFPFPDSNTNLLERFAHVSLAGNPVGGGKAVEGSLQANANWTAFPVVSSAHGFDYESPSVFSDDHFSELVGAPTSAA